MAAFKPALLLSPAVGSPWGGQEAAGTLSPGMPWVGTPGPAGSCVRLGAAVPGGSCRSWGLILQVGVVETKGNNVLGMGLCPAWGHGGAAAVSLSPPCPSMGQPWGRWHCAGGGHADSIVWHKHQSCKIPLLLIQTVWATPRLVKDVAGALGTTACPGWGVAPGTLGAWPVWQEGTQVSLPSAPKSPRE